MKHIYIVVMLCITTLSWTNVCGQCVNGISTNPDDPKNDQVFELFPGTTVNPFLNRFNWYSHGPSGFPDLWKINLDGGFLLPWSTGTAEWKMHSPFSGQMPEGYEYLAHPISSSIKDNRWEDGWELLWMNTGYWPSGEKINEPLPNSIYPNGYTAFHDRIPYVILYNRYTGVLRVFANVYDQLGDWKLLNIELKFMESSKNVSGIFRHLSSYDRPLDHTSKYVLVSSIGPNAQGKKQWVSADFQVGYDPCTCFYPSLYELGFVAIDSLDLRIKGRAIDQELDLVNYVDSLGDFLSVQNLEKSESGNVIYNTMDQMVDDYQKRLKKYNEDIAAYNAYNNNLLIKGFEALENNAGDLADGIDNGIAGMLLKYLVPTKITSERMQGCDACGDRYDSLKYDTSYIKGLTEDKVAGLLTGGIKSGISASTDFLSEQLYGKKPKEPKKPSRPVVNISEMAFSGTIFTSAKLNVNNLYNPGSFPSAYDDPSVLDPIGYPIYNEVLGLFALLKTPKFNIYTDLEKEEWSYIPHSPNGSESFGKKSRHRYRFGFAEDLEYALNPALDFDFDKTVIYGQLIVELMHNTDDSTAAEKQFSREHENVSWLRIDDGGTLCKDGANSLRDCRKRMILRTPMMPIEDMAKHTIGTDIVTTLEMIPKLKIFNGKKVYYNRPKWKDMEIDIKSIEFKIMADMYFKQKNSVGQQVNTTQTFTYPIYNLPLDEDGLVIQEEGESNDVYAFSENHDKIVEDRLVVKSKYKDAVPYISESVELSGTIYPTHPHVIRLENGVMYLQAMRAMVVDDLYVQPGYELVVQVVDYIDVMPDVNIDQDITFQTGIDMTNIEAKRLLGEDLENYCKKDTYKGNTVANKTFYEEKDNVQTNLEVSRAHIDFRLFPNPATSLCNVALKASRSSDAVLIVYNLTGQTIEQQTIALEKGYNLHQLSTESYANGLYLINVSINGHSTTQKLMIQQ